MPTSRGSAAMTTVPRARRSERITLMVFVFKRPVKSWVPGECIYYTSMHAVKRSRLAFAGGVPKERLHPDSFSFRPSQIAAGPQIQSAQARTHNAPTRKTRRAILFRSPIGHISLYQPTFRQISELPLYFNTPLYPPVYHALVTGRLSNRKILTWRRIS